MTLSSRERMTRTLTFDTPDRLPRDMWVLPINEWSYPEELCRIREEFPMDIAGAPAPYLPSSVQKGEIHNKSNFELYRSGVRDKDRIMGHYTDEWGCVFENIHPGLIGEVKEPIITEAAEWKMVKPPYETLPVDIDSAVDSVNRYCGQTDKFVIAGCCPRPWERMQFILGTENSMVEIMEPEEGAEDLIRIIHEFYMKELEFWVKTDVDAIRFMDDWGSQNSLLIPPRVWRELFKPLYKDYCDLIKNAGKFVFMHSDGHISNIYEDLIEVGVDAVNSQLFCMDMDELAQKYKGRITFWGEIDRQHVLTRNPEDGRRAVHKVAQRLYDPRGGVIAQLSFDAGSKPDTVAAVYDEWSKIGSTTEATV